MPFYLVNLLFELERVMSIAWIPEFDLSPLEMTSLDEWDNNPEDGLTSYVDAKGVEQVNEPNTVFEEYLEGQEQAW